MNVVLFGATGMVGQGVLRECLLDPRVTDVLTVGRGATEQTHAKLRELVEPDLLHLAPIAGYDACFFCLGVTSSGMSEADYRRITYDVTLAAANAVASPAMTFIFVSGAGTDGTAMWARVKKAAEDALLRMPFKAAYMFRPAIIRPMHGIKSKTTSYRLFYALAAPLMPLLVRMLPRYVTTTEQIGRAMINVAANGYPKHVLESEDINRC